MLGPPSLYEFQEEQWPLPAAQFAPASAGTVLQPHCGRPNTLIYLHTPPRLTVPSLSTQSQEHCCDSLTLVPPWREKGTLSFHMTIFPLTVERGLRAPLEQTPCLLG